VAGFVDPGARVYPESTTPDAGRHAAEAAEGHGDFGNSDAAAGRPAVLGERGGAGADRFLTRSSPVPCARPGPWSRRAVTLLC
jgi:hypothetical protein